MDYWRAKVVENVANKQGIKSKEEKEKNKRKQELEDIKSILKTKPGLRFFKRFLKEGRLFQTTFTGNSQTFFLEGHRNLGLIFFNDICEAAPDKIAKLMINKKEDDDG